RQRVNARETRLPVAVVAVAAALAGAGRQPPAILQAAPVRPDDGKYICRLRVGAEVDIDQRAGRIRIGTPRRCRQPPVLEVRERRSPRTSRQAGGGRIDKVARADLYLRHTLPPERQTVAAPAARGASTRYRHQFWRRRTE